MQAASRRNITAMFFDMDNTLFDFVEAKIAACTAVNEILGLDRGEDLLQYFLRDGHDFEGLDNIRDFMADNGIDCEETFARCCTSYETTKLARITAYPNTESTLRRLKQKGIALSVITDAHSRNARARLEKAGLADLFDHLVTCDMTGTKKPDPFVFQYALDWSGVPPDEVLVVGDSIRRDINPARGLGLLTAHAVFGDRNVRDDRTGAADVTLADVSDVLRLV
ncbi:MAG: HAD family hydrolase [Methanomicrobiales archaeon]